MDKKLHVLTSNAVEVMLFKIKKQFQSLIKYTTTSCFILTALIY